MRSPGEAILELKAENEYLRGRIENMLFLYRRHVQTLDAAIETIKALDTLMREATDDGLYTMKQFRTQWRLVYQDRWALPTMGWFENLTEPLYEPRRADVRSANDTTSVRNRRPKR